MAKQTADVLIRVPELAGLLAGEHKPAVLDVRWSLAGPPGRELYRAGHIPGAVFVDLDRDLAAPASTGPPGKGGRHPMPATADFERAMRRAGVDDGRPAVVYDAADSTAAARAWWLLRYFGHPSVRVLDGGFRAWTEAGRPTEPGDTKSADTGPADTGPGDTGPADTGPGDKPERPAGDFTARPGHMGLLDADTAASVARSGLLLDARTGERFRGEAEPVDRVAGHIPGAVSAPTTDNVNEDGTFLSGDDLAARFRSLGASADRPVAAYCGSGVTAAHEVLALTLAGIPAALYVGSWSNWITDPTRPIATGSSPE